MPSDRWLSSLDDTLTRAPAMPSVNQEHSTKFVCGACAWTGWDGVQHHRDTDHQHPIYKRGMTSPQIFGCCVEPQSHPPRVHPREPEGVET